MTERAMVAAKLQELYPLLKEEGIDVVVYPQPEELLVVFRKEGHDEVCFLPHDFISACVDQGYCYNFREELTQTIGRLKKAMASSSASAERVHNQLLLLVPELDDVGITIAISEEEPTWGFFMTRKGASRPVEFRLPVEIVEKCLVDPQCADLKKAALIAYHCLIGD